MKNQHQTASYPWLRTSLKSDAYLGLVDEMRPLIRDVAIGKPISAEMWRHWTSRHLIVLQAQNLGPWLHASLQQQGQASPPREISSFLARTYAASAIRGLFYEASLRDVLKAFQEASIPVIALKGAYLGLRVYRDMAQRPMGDLDLLVKEQYRQAAHEVMTRLGFEIQIPTKESEALVHPGLMYFRDCGARVLVDLHWGLTLIDYYILSPSIVWENTLEDQVSGFTVRFLDSETTFIHNALHMLNHYGGIRDRVDLITLCRRVPLNWSRLVDLAQSLRVSRPLYLVLHELYKDWSLPVPPEELQRASRHYFHWIEDYVIQGKTSRFWRWISRLRLFPDWGSRLRYLMNKIFPGKSYRQHVTGTPDLVTYWFRRASVAFNYYRKGLNK